MSEDILILKFYISPSPLGSRGCPSTREIRRILIRISLGLMDTTVYYLPGSLCLREYLLKSTKGTITNFFEQAIPSCKTVHTRLTNLYLISKFKLENQSWWDSATTCPIAGSKKKTGLFCTLCCYVHE